MPESSNYNEGYTSVPFNGFYHISMIFCHLEGNYNIGVVLSADIKLANLTD